MVQPKFNNALSKPATEKGVSAKEESREKVCWNWNWNTKIKPVEVMLYKTLHLGFTVWLFLYLICVLTENPGPGFVNVSAHFNYSFAGLNLEPGVNYLLWISVLVVPINGLFHVTICVGMLDGLNLIEVFRKKFRPNFVSKWLTSSVMQIFLSGFVLAFLRYNELPKSPHVISLLILHTCSGLVVLSYYMQMLSLPKQSPVTLHVSAEDDNRGKKSLTCSSAYKIIHLIVTVWLNLCLILFIMKTNPGPAFVDVGKRFDDILEPWRNCQAINLMLWIWESVVNMILWMFVLCLQLDALSHFSICYNLFAGTNNQLFSDFGGPVGTDYVLECLQTCFIQVLGCGVLLMLLSLSGVSTSPHILYLLILCTISGVLNLSYMGKLQTAKQIPTPNIVPDDDCNDGGSHVTSCDNSDGNKLTSVVTTE